MEASYKLPQPGNGRLAQDGTRPNQAKKRIKVMMFVPHADDEVLMAGGLVLRTRKELPHVDFQACLMTDGFEKELGQTRRNEFEKSCRVLGISDLHFFGFEPVSERWGYDYDSDTPKIVRYLDSNGKFVNTVADTINAEMPDAIIVHHKDEYRPHIDHVVTNRVVDAALHRLRKENVPLHLVMLHAQFWRDLATPNLFVGFGDDVFSLKLDAIHLHVSQIVPGVSRVSSYSSYDRMMEKHDGRSAEMGPQKVFDGGSKGAPVKYGELFERVTMTVDSNAGAITTTAKKSRFFMPDWPLTEDIFLPDSAKP